MPVRQRRPGRRREAETKGWDAPATDVLLPLGVVLLAASVLVERRVAHPLLPLRIVLSRFRGGAYLAIGLSSIGIFGIFLFLTYYLQETLGYSPVTSGVASLPMIAMIVAASTTSSGVLMPRFGPGPCPVRPGPRGRRPGHPGPAAERAQQRPAR